MTNALRFAAMEDCPPLVAVVFPAVVTSEGTSLSSAKVFIAADRAWVTIDTSTGPQVAEVVAGTVAVLGNDTYEITEDDGAVVTVRKGGGCGCGSKLRSWSPFTGPLRVGT